VRALDLPFYFASGSEVESNHQKIVMHEYPPRPLG
jgi:hypothetical protein